MQCRLPLLQLGMTQRTICVVDRHIRITELNSHEHQTASKITKQTTNKTFSKIDMTVSVMQ